VGHCPYLASLRLELKKRLNGARDMIQGGVWEKGTGATTSPKSGGEIPGVAGCHVTCGVHQPKGSLWGRSGRD
jgi:hypothetical protein